MALTFNYAVLQAIPDARRGERVNVGLVVFLNDRLDVRFSDVAKVRALTGEDWGPYINGGAARLHDSFVAGDAPQSIINRFSLMERGISISNVAWFSIVDISQYETRISEILTALVTRPQKKRGAATNRLNTEIAREFRAKKVLATSNEDISAHRIVREFEVSREEGLVADFALKNGVYHIATTLDLRRARIEIQQAALKAIVLDKAKEVFGTSSKRIGVYAADPIEAKSSPPIRLLVDYADETYNWLDNDERAAFTHRMYDAIHQPMDFQLRE